LLWRREEKQENEHYAKASKENFFIWNNPDVAFILKKYW